MAGDLCPHGDVLEACIDCTVAPPRPEIVPPVLGRHTFIAAYNGGCVCGEWFRTGDTIAAMTDDTYRHVACVTRWEDR